MALVSSEFFFSKLIRSNKHAVPLVWMFHCDPSLPDTTIR